MTREQFDQLVRAIETRYAGRPEALARRAALWALIGYGWFASTAMVVLVLSGFFFFLGIRAAPEGILFCVLGGLVLIAGGAGVVRTLWIQLAPPEGRAVSPEEAPILHQRLRDLRDRLKSTAFHKVLLVPDYNAAVVQTPRWGIFGWWRNYLLLGLPLMETLSEEEFCAVIAHEFAHLSRSHARFSHWVYRLRRVWEQIFQRLQAPRPDELSPRALQIQFIRWFWPRFNAHAFALSRANEYEADALAASITSGPALRSALILLNRQGRYLEKKFWPDLWILTATLSEPPDGVFPRMRDSILALRGGAEAERLDADSFRELTTNSDTHPCLKERLDALNALDPRSRLAGSDSPRNGPSGAVALLGSALEAVRKDIEALWNKNARANWKERHAKAALLQHHLSALAAAPSNTDVDALWDKATLKLQIEGPVACEPLVREMLSVQPRHARANLLLGRLLLDRGDVEGVDWIEKSMAEDEELVPSGCEALLHHFRSTGQGERLRATEARLDFHEAAVRASHLERGSVSGADDFVAHGLTEEELTALLKMLSAIPELAHARLGRKSLRHFPDQKLFVLSVTARKRWYQLVNTEGEKALVRRLSKELQLPGRLLVFSPRGGFRPIARKLETLPTSEIYPTAKRP